MILINKTLLSSVIAIDVFIKFVKIIKFRNYFISNTEQNLVINELRRKKYIL